MARKTRKYVSASAVFAIAVALEQFGVLNFADTHIPHLNKAVNAIQNALPGTTPLVKVGSAVAIAAAINTATPSHRAHLPLTRGLGIKP